MTDLNRNSSEQQARVAFGASVTNVAFALVLSRQMVDALRLVRDANGTFAFGPYLNPLARRGLVVIERGANVRSSTARLSVPGALVVSLLEQSGMIDEAAPTAARQEAA